MISNTVDFLVPIGDLPSSISTLYIPTSVITITVISVIAVEK